MLSQHCSVLADFISLLPQSPRGLLLGRLFSDTLERSTEFTA